jgi:hypothetical protein
MQVELSSIDGEKLSADTALRPKVQNGVIPSGERLKKGGKCCDAPWRAGNESG